MDLGGELMEVNTQIMVRYRLQAHTSLAVSDFQLAMFFES